MSTTSHTKAANAKCDINFVFQFDCSYITQQGVGNDEQYVKMASVEIHQNETDNQSNQPDVA